MLGKQWVDRYLRNRGGFCCWQEPGQAAEVGRTGEVEVPTGHRSLPAMLQLALLLGYTLSQYLDDQLQLPE